MGGTQNTLGLTEYDQSRVLSQESWSGIRTATWPHIIVPKAPGVSDLDEADLNVACRSPCSLACWIMILLANVCVSVYCVPGSIHIFIHRIFTETLRVGGYLTFATSSLRSGGTHRSRWPLRAAQPGGGELRPDPQSPHRPASPALTLHCRSYSLRICVSLSSCRKNSALLGSRSPN